MAGNVSICVRAGLPKPRAVPDSERNKDTKTLDYASTPLDANTVLPACAISKISICVGRNTSLGHSRLLRNLLDKLYFYLQF
jgi:hypothetical protein